MVAIVASAGWPGVGIGENPQGSGGNPQLWASHREIPRWDADERTGTDVAASKAMSARLIDPFLVFVLTGLSIGVVAGVVVGWGTMCLLGSLRHSDSSWPRAPRSPGPTRSGTSLVRCIRCKRTVCSCEDDWASP